LKILIELPTWLGDTVMISPSLVNIINNYKDATITVFGSKVSVEVIQDFPKIDSIFLVSKSFKSTYLAIHKIRTHDYDIHISFRSSFRSKLVSYFVKSHKKFQFNKNKYNSGHQVERYNNFINDSLKLQSSPGPLFLERLTNTLARKKIIGINPGAAFGSAKRWTVEGFCEVALELSKNFQINIYGSLAELDICKSIEDYLSENNVKNFINLCGKTTISELKNEIKQLSLFITGDSGPMHIAANYQVPSISIFGPTKYRETSQWKNKNSKVIKQNLDCQPCMKRECPLGHHNCMEKISSEEVIYEALKLL